MAGLIPKYFVEEVLQRSDLVDLIAARLQLKKSGSNFWGLCPFHQEKTASFSVDADGQFYHCFGCGAHGDALNFLMEYDNFTFVEAVEHLAARLGLSVPYEQQGDFDPSTQAKKKEQRQKKVSLLEAAADYFHAMLMDAEIGREARTYLRERGVKLKVLQRQQLGYAPSGDALQQALSSYSQEELLACGLLGERDGRVFPWFRNRLMFPIRQLKGEVIGFGARSLDGREPKYLNSPESEFFHKGLNLYGLFEARRSVPRLNELIVCEGYMDVSMLAQYELPYAVAALGTAFTAEQLALLKKQVRRIYFCFDGDGAGEKAARRALELVFAAMRDGEQHEWHFAFMPPEEDPDSLLRKGGRNAFLAVLQNSLSPSRFVQHLLGEAREDMSVEEQLSLIRQANEYISFLQGAEDYRRLLIDDIAARYQLDASLLQQSFVPTSVPRMGKTSPKPAARLPHNKNNLVALRLLAMLQKEPQMAYKIGDLGLLSQSAPLMEVFGDACRMVQNSAEPQNDLDTFLRDRELAPKLEELMPLYADFDQSMLEKEFFRTATGLVQRTQEVQRRLEKMGLDPTTSNLSRKLI